jgi:hypothetical protein
MDEVKRLIALKKDFHSVKQFQRNSYKNFITKLLT